MRFIVNNRQEPNGCLFLLFYGLRAVSISMGYIVMEEDKLVVAPWTLVPSRWHDGDHTKTHKMEI